MNQMSADNCARSQTRIRTAHAHPMCASKEHVHILPVHGDLLLYIFSAHGKQGAQQTCMAWHPHGQRGPDLRSGAGCTCARLGDHERAVMHAEIAQQKIRALRTLLPTRPPPTWQPRTAACCTIPSTCNSHTSGCQHFASTTLL